MKKSILKAFTLVELIVSITILAILGTIAFISLQGYSQDARNSVRMSDISNIDKALGIALASSGRVPFPDGNIVVTASGQTIIYQGKAGEKVLDTLGLYNGGKDPKDDTYYSYSVNRTLTKYQILGFLEGDPLTFKNLIGDVYADINLTNRTMITRGYELGILLDSLTNIPLEGNGEEVDIQNTTDTYISVFNTDIVEEGTGEDLFSYYYNRNEDLLENKTFAKFDENLVLYTDMETTTLSGAMTVLKDFSQYGNNGILGGGVTIGDEFGKDGKATYFDGDNDYIEILSSDSLNPEYITIMFNANFYGTGANSNSFPRILSKGGTTLSEQYAIWGNYTTSFSNFLSGRFETQSVFSNSLGLSLDNTDWSNIWKEVTIVYNGKEFRCFTDGVLTSIVKGTNYGTFIPSIKHLVLGNSGRTSGYNRAFYGLIDEVRIYNRALEDTEVSAIYNALK